MIRVVVCLGLVVLLAVPSLAATKFSITLDGAQANAGAGTGSPATGAGTAELFDLGGGDFRLGYTIDFSADMDWSGIAGVASNGGASTATRFHVHNQNRGVNGGVVYGLFDPSHDNVGSVSAVLNADNTTTISGSWDPGDGNPIGNLNDFAATGFPVGVATSLLALSPGDDAPLYFNVHTTNFGGGEIRGQLVAIPEPAAGILLLIGAVGTLLLSSRR